jgi:TonB-linked SusC/RagA family outer membrane protein
MTGKPSLKCLTAFLCLLLINASHLFAQEKIVTGKVKDPQGNPLPGVNVNVWGSRQSVTADVTGSFSIPVPSENSTLVFSFVGFLQKEVKVADQKDLQVMMAYDNADLDQVVVVGYGTQRRRDLTGSVYSVKPNMITQVPTSNPLEALQGRVPGLDVSRDGGRAGSGVKIQVRGQRTINGTWGNNAPLFIIDGFQGGNIADLNPNDIESVEVLKDASSTAIYGWQGGNGVIIVTTKKGKERPKVSYNGWYGVNGYASYPKGRMGEDYLELRRQAWKNGGPAITSDDVLFPNAGELEAFQKGQWVDWYDLLNRNGQQQMHNASIQSGGDKTKIYFGTSYYQEEGMLRNDDFKRYNARFNYDQRLSNVFKAGLLTQLTFTDNNRRQDPLSALSSYAPLGMAYDSLGRINLIPLTNGSAPSPLGDEIPGAAKWNVKRTNIMANGYFEVTPVNGLSLRTNLGTTISFQREGKYQDSLSFVNFKKSHLASQATTFSTFLNWDNIITFTRKIEDHSITLTGVTSYLQSVSEDFNGTGYRQLLQSQEFYSLQGTEQASRLLESKYEKYSSMSYVGRINYSFKGKYLLTASLRADGVSRLAPGNKWDYFPSAGIGWNIHQEEFMGNLPFVNNLKVRATYGIAGNASIAPYGTQSGLNAPTSSGSFGDVFAPVYIFKTVVGNPNLGWEKTSTLNIGLDFAFAKSRIYGSVDYYKAKTTDVLMERSLPISTGMVTVWQNIGETEGSGIEAALSGVIAAGPDFKWTSTITYSAATEKITKLVTDKDIIVNETKSLLIGHPVSSFYSFEKLGIWQSAEKAAAQALKFGTNPGVPFDEGQLKLADLNGDGFITDADDRKFLGSTVPKWFGGWQNSFSYKGLDLGVYIFARWGQTIEAKYMGRYNGNGYGNGPANFNYWTPDNPTNDFPRPKYNINGINAYNGYQALNFVDGSYFKIKTVTLGYTLPAAAARRVFTEKIRVYVTGNNIFTKAKNKLLADYDPERGGEEGQPLTRQVNVGVNVDF